SMTTTIDTTPRGAWLTDSQLNGVGHHGVEQGASEGTGVEGGPERSRPDHLDLLEAHAVFVLREVAAECERPVLLFSGGKDSAVLLRLAEKAFRPGRFPFPVLHVDTGHNFDEVLEFRDKRMAELGEELLVASVQDSIDRGRALDPGPGQSR